MTFISKTGIAPNNQIKAEHLTRIIDALSGVSPNNSGAYNFKQNIYDIVNGLITKITGSSYRNEITNGTGYTVDKLRIYLPRPTNPSGSLNAEAYSQVITAGTSVGTDFLTDNPSRVSNVLGSTSQSTDGFGMLDGLHYSNSGYSLIGIGMKDYYLPYRDE